MRILLLPGAAAQANHLARAATALTTMPDNEGTSDYQCTVQTGCSLGGVGGRPLGRGPPAGFFMSPVTWNLAQFINSIAKDLGVTVTVSPRCFVALNMTDAQVDNQKFL